MTRSFQSRSGWSTLAEQFRQRLATFHDRHWAAEGIMDASVGRDAQRVKDCRAEIQGTDRFVLWIRGVFVRFAEDRAAANALRSLRLHAERFELARPTEQKSRTSPTWLAER